MCVCVCVLCILAPALYTPNSENSVVFKYLFIVVISSTQTSYKEILSQFTSVKIT